MSSFITSAVYQLEDDADPDTTPPGTEVLLVLSSSEEEGELEKAEEGAVVEDAHEAEDALDAQLWESIAEKEKLGPQLGQVRGIGGGGGVGQPGVLATLSLIPTSQKRKYPTSISTPTPPAASRYFRAPSSSSEPISGAGSGLLCSLCGKTGHEDTLCLDNDEFGTHIICFICGRLGHERRKCPFSDSSKAVDCMWCGTSDHHFFECSKFNPKAGHETTTCFVCRKVGHVCCAEYQDLSTKKSCANCGSAGHVLLDCQVPTCEELLHPQLFNGNSISLSTLAACNKCGRQGHFERSCDDFRKYVLGLSVSSMSSSKRRR